MESEAKTKLSRKDRMEAILSSVFSPSLLEVQDVSNEHIGHVGSSPSGETHYRVFIQAEAFREMKLIDRHRAVYKALGSEFSSGLHALEIETKTEQETSK